MQGGAATTSQPPFEVRIQLLLGHVSHVHTQEFQLSCMMFAMFILELFHDFHFILPMAYARCAWWLSGEAELET